MKQTTVGIATRNVSQPILFAGSEWTLHLPFYAKNEGNTLLYNVEDIIVSMILLSFFAEGYSVIGYIQAFNTFGSFWLLSSP